jgi:hypothetical protein
MAEKKQALPAPESVTPPPPPKEKLLTFRAVTFFSDGNLRESMEKYGYACEWRTNEVRNLPAWLIKRCIQSGAELERADGG